MVQAPPPCLSALRLADADGLPEVAGGAQAGPERQQQGGCRLVRLPRGMGVLGAAGRGPLGDLPRDPSWPASSSEAPFVPGPCPCPPAPPISGLRLPGLRFWPQAAQRLVWMGRQKRTVETKSFTPSSARRALEDLQVLRSFAISSSCGPWKGLDACCVLALVFADRPTAARWARLAR